MEDIEIQIPEFFICPISLQIMKDPVTAITGITYDRESIEYWLFKGRNATCPVTKQPLPRDSDLTPNHTLRRLIQAWCTENAIYGVDRIPTPKAPLDKFHLLKLVKHLWNPQLELRTLRQLEILAAENERNRKYMVEAGVPKDLLTFTVTCFEKGQVVGLEEALSILHFLRIPSSETKRLDIKTEKIIEALTWILGLEIENYVTIKSHALVVLKKNIISTASSGFLEKLKPEMFQKIIGVLRTGITQQGINAGLRVLLDSCPWGRNRIIMVQFGAVFELLELELSSPETRTTELILGILFHLCSCADGRAEFLSHKGGVAVVTNRILKVSPASDDRAVFILSLISKFSGGNAMVIQEMLNVGAVIKLCKVLQVDCAPHLKEKAREILKSHYEEWKDYACINGSLLTGYPI